jgi:23S rRNA (cytidine2498-2'-O)-methyltransferase
MLSQFIITITPELLKSAMKELCSVAPDLQKIQSFKNGVCLVETNFPGRDFIRSLVQSNPIFIKHIMPVQAELSLSKTRDTDLPAILEKAIQKCSLSIGQYFAVQCRRVGVGYDYDAKDVEVFVGSYFESKGAVARFYDIKNAVDANQSVISVYLFEETGFIGFSTITENMNEYSDEYRIFSRLPRDVSRAEFKLIEALRKFRLDLPQGRALDLGAAPGGWTKVLADAGMRVVAIDPAELNGKVAGHPNVTHVKKQANDYVSDGDFDLLVNDMNMDPEDSARIMMQLAGHLKPGTYAIMTVKFVIRNPDRLLANVAPILEPAFDILDMKNLFHNRLEVTMLLRRHD